MTDVRPQGKSARTVSDRQLRGLRGLRSSGQPAIGDDAPGTERVAAVMAGFARSLADEKDQDATLQAIVQAAVQTVPGAQAACVTEVLRRREVAVRYATDERARAADLAQHDHQDGPCMDGSYHYLTIRVVDFADETRWTAFATEAMRLGWRSMLALQLYVERDDLGVLNLYSTQVDAFDDASESVGLLFATHAAVALAGVRRAEQLQEALTSRDLLGQAKGILMERYRITADEAFAVLVRTSQATNVKVAEIAEDLAATGHIDDPRLR